MAQQLDSKQDIKNSMQALFSIVQKINNSKLFCQNQSLSTGLMAEHPITLEEPTVSLLDSPYAEVRSSKSIRITDETGVCAELQGEPIVNVKNLTTYYFGHIVFHILDENGAFIEECPVAIGFFKTFEFGKPENQITEFLATVFDIELTAHGFQCSRKNNTLVFQSLPDKAGLNLKIVDMYLDPPKVTCDFGLTKGMETLQPGQKRGKAAITSFGKLEINGIVFDLLSIKRQEPTLEKVKEKILSIIHEKIDLTQVCASFDADDHLVLTHLQPGKQHTIEVKNLLELASPATERISLGIPDGIFLGKDNVDVVIPQTDFGRLTLNHITFNFGKINNLEHTPETAAQSIVSKINAQSAQTGIMAGVDMANRLLLSPLRDDVSLIIGDIQDSNGESLEISALGLRSIQLINQKQYRQQLVMYLQQFVKNFNHLSTQLHTPTRTIPIDATLKEQLLETILKKLPPLEGLQVKSSTSYLLGPQLSFQPEQFWQHWKTQMPQLSQYFQYLMEYLEPLVLAFKTSPSPIEPPLTPTTLNIEEPMTVPTEKIQVVEKIPPLASKEVIPVEKTPPLPDKKSALKVNIRYMKEILEKKDDDKHNEKKTSSFDHTI